MSHASQNRVLLVLMTAATAMGVYFVAQSWLTTLEAPSAPAPTHVAAQVDR